MGWSMVPVFADKTTRVNQMWQTDFTYFKIIGWGWYYLSTVLDDYSRYIVCWELCSNMTSKDAEQSIEKALQRTGLKNKTLQDYYLITVLVISQAILQHI